MSEGKGIAMEEMPWMAGTVGLARLCMAFILIGRKDFDKPSARLAAITYRHNGDAAIR